MRNSITIITMSLLLGACAVNYTADPVTELENSNNEICVIKNLDSKEEFLSAYKINLEKRNFKVEFVAPGSDLEQCSLMSKYVAQWSWDFTTYLSSATIYIYENSKLKGKAEYRAPSGGWSLTTKIYDKTESKIDLLLEQLFPWNSGEKVIK